ncbi:MAG: VWA domain-containing protein [Clostridia bacterium]|nr:VWA domain-containing protein [Clostridia bacterium]
MSEWDDPAESKKLEKSVSAGSWDVVMSIAALIAVAAVSFLAAYLTKDVLSRPIWMLFLSFAAPVAALMLAVFLKEKISPSMTPSSSRKAQLILAACTVAAAGLVGCFCMVSNVEARGEQTVVMHDGWSDVLIILDKSGSMNGISESGDGTLDKMATEAVIDLINRMDESTRVGMLIDVGWAENNDPIYTIPLEERAFPIAELNPDYRQKLIELARCETAVNEHFPRAFEVACDMINAYDGENGELSIVIISDGQDCTGEFRASDFYDRLHDRGVKVFYLYVVPEYSKEMELLASRTGGESIYVNNLSDLMDKMQEVTKVPVYETVYKDALRDIDESGTAKAVTGILLAVLGLLIGITLTVMFSLQGQKRFQLILSPIMALLAFAVLAFGKEIIPVAWIREGIAFTLLGVVLMRKNRSSGFEAKSRPAAAAVSTDPLPDSSDGEW